MIDTIVLKYSTPPPKHTLTYWTETKTKMPNGQIWVKHYINLDLSFNIPIGLTYYPPNDAFSDPALFVQVSLPKVLYGNNVQLLVDEAEISEAVRVGNELLEKKIWAPEIDLAEGILHRVDVAYNHQVGDQVQEYIYALQNLTYPHRKTMPYPHEGVQYRSRYMVTKFYSKQMDDGGVRAAGILRQETTIRKTHRIEKMMGVEAPMLKDITREWVLEVLDTDLHNLRLKNAFFGTESVALQLLVERYGWNPGARLFGHLYARSTLTKDQLIAYRSTKGNGRLSQGEIMRSIRRDDKLLAEVGLGLTMVGSTVPLPALRVG